jgi:hypothetical protein
MLSILSSILGFATAGLPSILGFFQQKGDQKHEKEMAQLQMQQQMAMAEKGFQSQEKIAAIELEGTYAETFAQERQALYTNTMLNWCMMLHHGLELLMPLSVLLLLSLL